MSIPVTNTSGATVAIPASTSRHQVTIRIIGARVWLQFNGAASVGTGIFLEDGDTARFWGDRATADVYMVTEPGKTATAYQVSGYTNMEITPGTSTNPANPVSVASGDSPAIDAFGRWRVSNPETIFDSKNIFNDPGLADNVENQPVFYDNQQVSGTGTTTQYNNNQASNTIAVSSLTAGRRVRQTFRRFNYQPLKSQLHANTFVLGQGATPGITIREGLFDDDNGIFVEVTGEGNFIVLRTSTSGTPSDNRIAQADWNLDKMDGTGKSGVTIDLEKTQIWICDYEWLGVGRVRVGWVVDGMFIYCHEFLNANNLDVVYMSTPNLPIRTEISNDGTGPAASITQICSSVLSEGGTNALGQIRSTPAAGSHSGNAIGTRYLTKALRLRGNYEGLTAKILKLEILSIDNTLYEWELIFKATLSGTPSGGWLTQDASGVEYASGDGVVTVSGGYVMASGIAQSKTIIDRDFSEALVMGCAIDKTKDVVALVVRPVTVNQDFYSSIGWREL